MVVNGVDHTHDTDGATGISKGSRGRRTVLHSGTILDTGSHSDVPHAVNVVVADGLLGVSQRAWACAFHPGRAHRLHRVGVHLVDPLATVVFGDAVRLVCVR